MIMESYGISDYVFYLDLLIISYDHVPKTSLGIINLSPLV